MRPFCRGNFRFLEGSLAEELHLNDRLRFCSPQLAIAGEERKRRSLAVEVPTLSARTRGLIAPDAAMSSLFSSQRDRLRIAVTPFS